MIKLVLDSTSCVRDEFRKENDISVIDLNISIDDFEMKEGTEKDPIDSLYAKNANPMSKKQKNSMKSF